MTWTQVLQEIRRMRFEEAYGRFRSLRELGWVAGTGG